MQTCVGRRRGKTFLFPQNSSGWPNNQLDMRQISKRKLPNLIHAYVWELRVRDPVCTRGSEIQRGIKAYKISSGKKEIIHLRGFKGSL